MLQKRYVGLLVAVVLGACAVGMGCNKLRARDKLNKGVDAYKNAKFDVAIEDFKEARSLDPTLTNAQLYLAAAYANQYVPGAPSPENLRNGNEALKVYKEILQKNPDNLRAIDGVGWILYNMAGTPFNADGYKQAKSYYMKHIDVKSDDPEPYYWVGVIDWNLAYHANREMRDQYNHTVRPNRQIKPENPLPSKLRDEFTKEYGSLVDEGITDLNKAISLRPDYDDAMAYLNLLLRQKADMETNPEARAADLKKADELVEKVKVIKQKKANMQPNS